MIGIALMAVLMCVNFTSCSEDDDTTDNGGGNAVTDGNRITKVVSASEDWVETRTYSYDNNGRLVEATEIDEHNGGSRTRTYQFVWGDNTILVNYGEESVSRSGYTDSYIVTLENGLVRNISDNDGNSNTLIYSNNRLAEIVDRSTVVWNGDKVKSISDAGEGWTCTFSYEKSYKGYSPLFLGALDFSFDAILFEAHPEIIGMQTSQLPTSLNINGKKITYEYEFDKDGNITNIIETAEDGSTTSYSTTWNSKEDDVVVEKEKKLTKIVGVSVDEYGTDTETYTFSYDKEGRLTETTHREFEDDSPHAKQFVWEDGVIKVYANNYYDDDAYLHSVFNVKNGLVQVYEFPRYEYSETFTYNSSNKFIGCKYVDEFGTSGRVATWNNDKMTSTSKLNEDGTPYVETTLNYKESCKKGYYPFIIDMIGVTECEIIFMAHPEIGGMRTSQLPSDFTKTDSENSEYNSVTTCEYEFDKDGYISKIIETKKAAIEYESSICTYTLTWE